MSIAAPHMADCAMEVQILVPGETASPAPATAVPIAPHSTFSVDIAAPSHHIVGDMRFVLDTSVVVAGMRSPHGASADLIRRARHGELTLLASTTLLFEYESVLSREAHLEASGLALAGVSTILDNMASFMERIETHFMWRPRLRDANDDMVLEVAANGQADAIVSFNVRDFVIAEREFGIRILVPGAALRRLKDEI